VSVKAYILANVEAGLGDDVIETLIGPLLP